MKIEVDKTLVESLPSGYNFLLEPMIFVKKVETIKEKGKFGHRVFLATIYGAYLYKSKLFKKQLILSEFFSWDQVREMTSPEEGQILIKYSSGQFHFKDDDWQAMIELILNNMVMVFSPSELPTYTLGQTVPTPDYSGDFLPQYRRFLYKCKQYQKEPSIDILRSLNEYSKDVYNNVSNTIAIFDIGKIQDFEEYAEMIFESFDVCPYLKALVIPPTKEHKLWNLLANYIRKNSIISHIIIKDEITEDFTNVIQAIIQNRNSHIQSITFKDTIVTPQNLKLLNELMCVKPVVQINFDNAVDKFRPIITVFAQMKSFTSIRFLSISNVKGASPKLALKHLPKLLRLDFSYNDVDITPTIKEMVSIKHCKIREINCCGNYCKMLPQRKMKLPKKMNAFKATDVNWFGNNLLSFIKIFSRNSKKPELRWAIDLSNAKVEQENWDLFFTRIPSFPIEYLSVFRWDNNPIMPGFFEFLSGSKVLNNLSLSGDLSTEDETLSLFCDFMANNKTIRKLTVAGSETKKLKKGLSTLLESISANRIQVLDISNNDAQDAIFLWLQKYVEANKWLKQLFIDSNHIQTIDVFQDFILFLKKRQIGITIAAPKNDLSDLSQRDREFRKGKVVEIIADLKLISSFKPAIPANSSLKKKASTKKKKKVDDQQEEKQEVGKEENIEGSQKSSSLNQEEEEKTIEDMPNEDNLAFSDSSSDSNDDDQSDPNQNDQEKDKEDDEEDKKDNNNEEEDETQSPSILQVAPLQTSLSPVEDVPLEALPQLEEEKDEKSVPQEQWFAIGTCSWENVERMFLDDDIWMENYKEAPSDFTDVARNAYRRDFSIKRLIAGLHQK